MSPTRAAWLCSSMCLLIVAPMAAHATWRPLALALGGPTSDRALAVSLAAAAVAALTAAARWQHARATPAVSLAVVACGLGLGGPAAALSLLGVAGLTAAALPHMAARLAPLLQETGEHRARRGLAVWCAVALACAAGAVDLATYLGDPAATRHGIHGDAFIARHFCASAYFHAAELVRAGSTDIYDLSLVSGVANSPLPDSAAHMAPFTLDRYGYPPQFLLAPLALVSVVGDFAAQRAVWCCGNALLFAAVLWRVGLWVGPHSGRIARWAAPIIWLASGVTFQIGNVQLVVFGLSMLAMIAFDERRERAGGAFLAAATLAKIAPGLLGVLLLAQRRWRGALWAVAFATLITAVAVAVLGPGVFWAFASEHLPHVSSGEAYDFLDDTPRHLFENLSPFGIPFKLAALGVPWDPWVWGPRFAGAYTAAAFALAAVAGRRVLDRRAHAAVWMLVFTIACLRSPMAPGYMLVGVVWALLLASAEVRTARGGAGLAVLLTNLALLTPFAPESLPIALAGQAVMHGAIVWLLLRAWPVLDPTLQPHTLGATPRSRTSASVSPGLSSGAGA